MNDISPELSQAQLGKDGIRNGKNGNESVKSRLKRAAGNIILKVPIAAMVLLSGNVESPIVPVPNITRANPISTFKELPKQGESAREVVPTLSISMIDFSAKDPIQKLKELPKILSVTLNPDMRQAIMPFMIYFNFNHGELVEKTIEKIARNKGFQSTPHINRLQEIVGRSDIKEVSDEMGNSGISISIKSERIINLLKSDTSQVVNGSFQVGTVEMFAIKKEKIVTKLRRPRPRYERDAKTHKIVNPDRIYLDVIGSIISEDKTTIIPAMWKGTESDPFAMYPVQPISLAQYDIILQTLTEREQAGARFEELDTPDLRIVGAYTKEKAIQNLTELFKVCNAYPDKFFVMAAGNFEDDLIDALDTLKDQRPKNVLFVAQWTKWTEYDGDNSQSGKPTSNVYGADIHVNNSFLGIDDGSSFSAPVISVEVATLLAQGVPQDQIKDRLLASTITGSVQRDAERYEVRVFDSKLLTAK